jgi:hypothetical protein
MEQRHELIVNGVKIATGDFGSIGMLAGNVTGKNFQDRESWREQTHAQYLAWVGAEWGVTLAPVMEVIWGPIGGPADGRATIQTLPN